MYKVSSNTQARHIIFSPSILSADFAALGDDIRKVTEGGTEYLHIDVMDGMFVPSISLGMPVIKSIRKISDLVFDVHLMIVDPLRYIEEFARSGADLITFHLEAAEDPQAVIDKIREFGCRVGISINPETSLDKALPWLPKVDMLLIMSVHPGFGGQKYIPSSTEKIRTARSFITEEGLSCDIEVDGGIKLDNVRTVLDAGANVIVAGSAVFGGDAFGNTVAFEDIFHEFESGECSQ